MAQLSLFDESASGTTLPRDLLDYVPGIFSPEESRTYLAFPGATASWLP